jgi:hypothetical protein
MIPWKLVHLWMGVSLVISVVLIFAAASPLSTAVSYGLGLGWLNLFSLVFIGKSMRQGTKLKQWYFPVWMVKWVLLGILLFLALKANLSPIGLISGFVISLTILAVISFGSIRNVLHSRSS